MLLTERNRERNSHSRMKAGSLRSLVRAVGIGSQTVARPEPRAPFIPASRKRLQKNCGKRAPEAGIDPLYLFACSVLWHRQRDAGAGWELIRGLKYSEPSARIAAALLSESGNG